MIQIRTDKPFEKDNARLFRQEIKDLRTHNPTIIAMGNDVYTILTRNLSNEFKILKIPH